MLSADTHVTNAASMLDNGNNWMPIYVKYNWDFIEIMPLIRLDSAACKVKSVLCHLFVIFLQQFVSDAKLRPCSHVRPHLGSEKAATELLVSHTLQYTRK